MKKILTIILLSIFISGYSKAQFTNYTMADGLVYNKVSSIAIDAQGNKWFGANDGPIGGVSKFDGTTWTNYTSRMGLGIKNVTSIAIDAQGNKWFGTQGPGGGGGVSKFDGTTWTNYSTVDGLVSNYVTSIAIDAQGNNWFGTRGGVSKFDGTTWTNYKTVDGLANNKVNSIAIDAQGNKWFGTYDGGVSKFDGTTWTNYTTANGLVSNDVTSIAIDAQGNKWFGTYDGGVSKFDGTTWTNYTTADGLVNNSVTSIAIEAQGNKWIGTGGGVSKFDGTTWTNYTTVDGLVDNYVTSIAIDAQGNKCFGADIGVSLWCSPIQTIPTITPSGTTNLCLIDFIQLTASIGNSYLWSNGETSQTISTNVASNYTVRVSNAFGCKEESLPLLIIKDETVLPTPTITSSGSLANCNNLVTLTSSLPNCYWMFSSGGGSITQTMSTTSAVSGNLIVQYNNMCRNVTPFVINDIVFPTVDICLVTNQKQKNLIVWQKTPLHEAGNYKIYKQNNTTSNYDLIHEQPYVDLSEYLDVSSTPNTLLARYKISFIDTCGRETLSSNHTTILLSSNLGTNNTVNLSWNAYEGFIYSNFEIWRSLDGINYSLLTTVANNTYSYIDVNPNTQSYYQIRIVNPNNCTSTKSSFSGVASNIIDKSGNSVTGVSENSINNLTIYPNPTNDKLYFKNIKEGDFIKIQDLNGREIYIEEVKSELVEIDLTHYACKGIYFVSILNNNSVLATKKIALQ